MRALPCFRVSRAGRSLLALARTGVKVVCSTRAFKYFFYDDGEKKFRRKTFFSYGFVNNEVECEKTKDRMKVRYNNRTLLDADWSRHAVAFHHKEDFCHQNSNGFRNGQAGKEFISYGESILEKTK